jgi:hypothetical protein
MADYLVNCRVMSPGGTGCEHITHLGIVGLGLQTVAWVIDNMQMHRFHTMDQHFNRRPFLEKVDGSPPYVRTERDGTENDNLLKLPICSASDAANRPGQE